MTLSERLRDVAAAYPEDIFPPFTDDERRENSVIISRASGNMGRFLSRHMTEAADTIDALVEALEKAHGHIVEGLTAGRVESIMAGRDVIAAALAKARGGDNE